MAVRPYRDRARDDGDGRAHERDRWWGGDDDRAYGRGGAKPRAL